MSETHLPHVPSDLLDAALALPPQDRAALVDALVCSLDVAAAPGVEAAWAKEIERRMAQFERDESIALPGERVLAELRAKWPK